MSGVMRGPMLTLPSIATDCFQAAVSRVGSVGHMAAQFFSASRISRLVFNGTNRPPCAMQSPASGDSQLTAL
jgi:hypothetical protein